MIGVFDSGVGGLSVLRALRTELPHEDFCYLADSGHAPYGERDNTHVIGRSRAIAGWLVGRQVEALVIACNTATAAAIEPLRAAWPSVPMVGVEPALKPAVALSRTGHVGVLATRGTLASARFGALRAAQGGAHEVSTRACDGLADAIERAAASGDQAPVRDACARHLAALGRFGDRPGEIDTLVLGCTHYPFAIDSLRELLGPTVNIVDNGAAIARQTRRLLRAPRASGDAGTVELFGSGDLTSLRAGARAWLGLDATVGASDC